MSKIVIAGEAVVVTSTMSLEDLKTIAKYRPEALTLKGGEDGKEPIFSISTGVGAGDISQYGATFATESHDDKKLATITLSAVGATGDIKEYIADILGKAKINLDKLEEKLPGVLEEIKAEKASVMSSITVVQ